MVSNMYISTLLTGTRLSSCIKWVTVFVFMYGLLPGYAQTGVSIYPVQPTGYHMHYHDLWNVNITVNPVNTSAYYFLEIEISDKQGIPLWKARSYTFPVTVSPYWITSGSLSEIEPVDVVFSNDDWYEKMTIGGGLFPPGDYTITYRLVQTTLGCTTSGKLEAVASYFIAIKSMYPPTLLFPFDNDTVTVEPVIFTWVPPYPLYPNQEITYELRITEVMGMQKPMQSLSANNLFFSAEGIELTQFPYPPDARELIAGMRYAWQIVAYDTRNIIGYSPVWSFVVKEPIALPRLQGKPKVLLSLSKDPATPYYSVKTDMVSFKYTEAYNDTDELLNYSIYDETSNEKLRSGTTQPLSVGKGYNAYQVDVSGLNNGNYSLVIENDKSTKYYLRFLMIPVK